MIKKLNVPLKYLTSFQLEGSVKTLYIFQSLAELSAFRKSEEPALFLGLGSNSLIDPETVKPIIQIHPALQFPVIQDNTLVVGAGVTVNQFLKFCVSQGIAGFEFAAGVPATVGGMVAMNFGCWGQEISSMVLSVEVMYPSGRSVWVKPDALAFGYRTSAIQTKSWIVTRVAFRLVPGASETIQDTIKKNIQTRVQKQPLKDKTFGSTFKNPQGHTAGEILDQLGYRGKKIGAVTFSAQHANFLVNSHQATFNETVDVLYLVQEDVRKKTGIFLELEVKLLS